MSYYQDDPTTEIVEKNLEQAGVGCAVAMLIAGTVVTVALAWTLLLFIGQ